MRTWLLALMLTTMLAGLPALAMAAEAPAPAAGEGAEEEEGQEEEPNMAFVLGVADLALGGALVLTGGIVQVVGDDEGGTAAVFYCLGGFVGLIGVYVLATGLGGHPGEPAPAPAVGVAPWVAPGAGGAGLTLRW